MDSIEKDETLDLTALLQEDTSSEEKVEAVKELSPAEKILEDRKNNGVGAIVENSDLKKGAYKPLKNPIDNDKRLEDYTDQDREMLGGMENRMYLILKYKPTNDIEHSEMMNEILTFKTEDLVALQNKYPNGATLKSKYFNLAPKENTKVETAARIHEEPVTEQPVEKGTPTFTKEENKEEETPEDDLLAVTEEDRNPEVYDAEEEEVQKIVRIIIDKTNLGVPAELSEVEKDKILTASQIDVVEVENLNLSTMVISKAPKSFVETIGQYEYQGVQIPMSFPCSRFRATMMGLSYGEMADIALSYDNSTYETERKKLTIIYNKMKNITCGMFETFDDFLDGFAYADVDLSVYGLYLASCPEKDMISLKCGKPSCDRSFNAPFVARSLLDLNRCSKVFLSIMKELVEANGERAKELRDTSPIFKQKAIRLPISGWIVKIGMMTCRDWLEGVMKNGEIEEFKKTHPDDVNGVLYQNILFFQTVRAIYVPDGQGGYWEYTDYSDILEALYVMNPDDFQMLGSIMNKYTGDYSVYFSIKDVTCPHCKTHTDSVDVTIDNMVFRAYQRRISTTVNLEKLQDF